MQFKANIGIILQKQWGFPLQKLAVNRAKKISYISIFLIFFWTRTISLWYRIYSREMFKAINVLWTI
jgi:hypothetical protein